MALWGFLPEDDAEGETGYVYDRDTEWSFGSVLARLLATPFSLALDCLTCPVQAVLFGDDDERDCHCASPR